MKMQLLGLAALLMIGVLPAAQAAASCTGLIGTWQASYRIGASRFVDTFIVRASSPKGIISGIDDYGIPMHGFCRNGTVFLTEDYEDNFLEAYYFTNGTPAFGRHMSTISFIKKFETGFDAAVVKKISSSTTKSAPSGAALPGVAARKYLKLQESQGSAAARQSMPPEQ